MLKEFSISDIGSLDGGRVGAAIARDLRVCVADCVDRPFDKTKRKVVVELEVEPVLNGDGIAEDVYLEATSVAKIPKKRSKPFHMGAKPRGELVFNDVSPDDRRQMTVDEAGVDKTTGEVVDGD